MDKEVFADLCQKYERHKSEFWAARITNEWSKFSSAEVANCLSLYGKEVFSSNLWDLYFKTMKYRPFEKEVERVLLKKALTEDLVFGKIPHALSEENELKLLDLNANQLIYNLDLPIAVTSFSMTEAVGEPKNESEWLILNNRDKIKIMCSNLKSYLERVKLSAKSLQRLIDDLAYAKNRMYPYFSRDYLTLAVETLAAATSENALDCLDLQLQLLKMSVWNKQERVVCRPLMRYALSRYTMEKAPSEIAVKRLLKLDDINILREVLAHSWLEKCKNLVLAVYPELEAEILLAEVSHAAFLENSYEQVVAESSEYVSAVLKQRDDCNLLHGKRINKVSALALCLQMNNTYHNCRYDGAKRFDILQKAVNYCQYYNSYELNKFIPLLQQCAEVEKHRLYSL